MHVDARRKEVKKHKVNVNHQKKDHIKEELEVEVYLLVHMMSPRPVQPIEVALEVEGKLIKMEVDTDTAVLFKEL